MNILVYGSNGWIGTQFIKLLKKEHNFYSGKARCNNRQAIIEEIKAVKPTHVVFL